MTAYDAEQFCMSTGEVLSTCFVIGMAPPVTWEDAPSGTSRS